jgi:hypothetical protein
LVEQDNGEDQPAEVEDDGESLFIPEPKPTFGQGTISSFGSFNPQATSFTPSSSFGTSALPASSPSGSGAAAALTTSSFGSTIFGQALNAGFGKTTQEPSIQGFSGSFGQGFGASNDATPKLTNKFGQTPTTKFAFGQSFTNSSAEPGPLSADDNTPPESPNLFSKFGTTRPSNTENNPFGQPAQAAVPNHISKFGQPRASTEVNNPFGATQPSSSGFAGSTVISDTGLGAKGNNNAGSDSTTTTTPAFKVNSPFGISTPSTSQPAEPTIQAAQPPASASEAQKPLFTGFNFGTNVSTSAPAPPQLQPLFSQPSEVKTTTQSAPFSFLPVATQTSGK